MSVRKRSRDRDGANVRLNDKISVQPMMDLEDENSSSCEDYDDENNTSDHDNLSVPGLDFSQLWIAARRWDKRKICECMNMRTG
eukprot:CAMPEP_0194121606 /NCGR_PEP_ID=MMETSP0150-20130528/47685_1 /TAXON_ID=122233 /ORGANISM="Chaetoceros debilis, Strain MM31A-1" /LENGTH=83 /DNA_ID=CAMNT_0038814117 /DNA_START=176 /DNA_END=424 /DNA_ORIENTATION=+